MTTTKYRATFEQLAEFFGIDAETLENVHENGMDCPKCGEYLADLNEVTQHTHEEQ